MEFKSNRKQSAEGLKKLLSRAAGVQDGLPPDARPQTPAFSHEDEEPTIASQYLIGEELFKNSPARLSDDFEEFLSENEEYSTIIDAIPNPNLDNKCWIFVTDVLDILSSKGIFNVFTACPDPNILDFFESIEEMEKEVYNKSYFSYLSFNRKDSKNMCLFLKDSGEITFVIQGDKARATPYNLCKNLEKNKKDFYKDLMSFVKLCLNV